MKINQTIAIGLYNFFLIIILRNKPEQSGGAACGHQTPSKVLQENMPIPNPSIDEARSGIS